MKADLIISKNFLNRSKNVGVNGLTPLEGNNLESSNRLDRDLLKIYLKISMVAISAVIEYIDSGYGMNQSEEAYFKDVYKNIFDELDKIKHDNSQNNYLINKIMDTLGYKKSFMNSCYINLFSYTEKAKSWYKIFTYRVASLPIIVMEQNRSIIDNPLLFKNHDNFKKIALSSISLLFLELSKICDIKFNSTLLNYLDMHNQVLTSCEFSSCEFNSSTFNRVKFIKCKFDNVNFNNVTFTESTFEECSFIECDIMLCDLTKAKFIKGGFKKVNLSPIKWDGLLFHSCYIIDDPYYSIRSIDIKDSNSYKCTLTNCPKYLLTRIGNLPEHYKILVSELDAYQYRSDQNKAKLSVMQYVKENCKMENDTLYVNSNYSISFYCPISLSENENWNNSIFISTRGSDSVKFRHSLGLRIKNKQANRFYIYLVDRSSLKDLFSIKKTSKFLFSDYSIEISDMILPEKIIDYLEKTNDEKFMYFSPFEWVDLYALEELHIKCSVGNYSHTTLV